MPTRRAVLLGSAGSVAAAMPLAAVASAAPTQQADAELIAVCDLVVASIREVEDALEPISGIDPTDEQIDAVAAVAFKERDGLLDRMAELRATSPAGICARARALAASNPTDGKGFFHHSFDGKGDHVGRQLDYLLRMRCR